MFSRNSFLVFTVADLIGFRTDEMDEFRAAIENQLSAFIGDSYVRDLKYFMIKIIENYHYGKK